MLPMTDSNHRRLRLAQVVTRMDIGGVPEHVMTLIRELRHDFDVTVICGDINDIHRHDLTEMNVAIESIPFRRLLNPLADIKTFFALFAFYRLQKFDVVHTHMSKAALIGSIAAVCARIPVIVNTAHNLGFIALPNRALKLLFWVYDFVLLRATMDAVITVSMQVRERIVQTRLLSPTRVFAVHNGMSGQKMKVSEGDAAARRAEFGVSSDEILIVSVARLVWFKGLSTLISAMPLLLAKYPGARIVVAGEGPLREELTKQAEDLGVGDRLVLTGERCDIPAILSAADIFVLPSVSEGMPISIMEAMAAGRPVVATDVGGVAELVDHNETGLLVPPRTPPALADALAQLALDPKQRAAMGARGQRRIASEFSPQQMAESTAAIYRGFLARKSRSG